MSLSLLALCLDERFVSGSAGDAANDTREASDLTSDENFSGKETQARGKLLVSSIRASVRVPSNDIYTLKGCDLM